MLFFSHLGNKVGVQTMAREIRKMEDYEGDTSAHEKLAEPIKIQWQPGKMRSRIQERLGDYCSWTEIDGERVVDPNSEQACAAVAVRTLLRQKTNVVIETVEEATALHNELTWYSDGGGRNGITWMNGVMEKSIRRIRSEIRNGLEERGYTVEYSDRFWGKIYVVEVEGTQS